LPESGPVSGRPVELPVELPGLGEVTVRLGPEALDRLRAELGADERPRAPVPSRWLTAQEAADVLRCTRRRIYALVADGRLKRHGDGRRLLVRRREVERLAEGE
jgi:excisionase family DNA binding protein